MAKKYDGLYEEIINFDNLLFAYRQTIKGYKKFRKDAIIFSILGDLNLVKLWQELKSGKYEVGDYVRFKVFEPKERWVSAPRIRDKIVQFATHTILKNIYKNVFISDCYACLEDRGTHKAVGQLQKYMRIADREWENPWVVKFDISKFFYTIDREILKQILRKKIKCKKTLWLLDLIIDSSPEGGVGIPLGNVTSQDFANIYLNELDQFVKRFLGIKYYVRYMDDAIAVVRTKEDASNLMQKMIEFSKGKLHLKANTKKTQIFPVSQGVNAYGFKIWTTHRKIRDQSKRAMKRRIKAMDRKIKDETLTEKEVKQAVDSWIGHARHSNSYNLAKKIFTPYPYIEVEGDEYFGKR